MTATTTTIEQPAGGGLVWYALSAQDVTTRMGVDSDEVLAVVEVERRLAEYGPNERPPSVAFDIVSPSADNIGLVMRRERQAPWSSPVFPYLGWIILGWILSWAAVELNRLQRLRAVVAVDKVIQLRGQNKALIGGSAKPEAGRSAVLAST